MLFNLLRSGASAPGEVKASAVGGMIAFSGAGRAVWGPRDDVSLTRAGYQGNAVAFRSVRMVAEAAAAVPLRLTVNGAQMAEHPILRLLASPNNGQDGAGLMEAVIGHLMLFGDAYLEAAALDDRGAPAELHTLPA